MRILALICVSLGICGCALRQDERLRFVQPPPGAEVGRGPVAVQWRFDGPPPSGGYAVFVDTAPMRPGRDVDSLADRDPLCRRSTSCPDSDWLADHGIYLTSSPRLVLPALPSGRGRRASLTTRRHEVTIVLLDADGSRMGESAWARALYAPGGRRGR